jgi:4-diphosphocytidyl-2-C-methyl-D-erythritol kinase
MDNIVIKAPAKINLGLNVTEKREDGYHNIQTIFYPIQLCDVIKIDKAEITKFRCSDPNLPHDETNLVIKAKNIIEQYVEKIFNVDIYLEKKTPIGAGLGGGSSDAAAVLLALNELFNLKLTHKELHNLAFALGSDVPFFINPLPAFAALRGEELKYLNLKIDKPILIVYPGIHVSTKWAYSKITPKFPEHSLLQLNKIDFEDQNIRRLITNDFEGIVFNEFPDIARLKELLINNGALFALMSGSGSSVFGIFEDLDRAIEAKGTLSKNYFTFIHYEKT